MNAANPTADRVERTDGASLVDLRHRILRADLPRAAAIFAGDDDAGTVHYALRTPTDDRVIACGTFMREPYDGQPAWRLRGMAVDAAAQRAGLGSSLLAGAERDLLAIGYSRLLWCNARSPAIGFYERAGWHVVSDEFDIPTAGPHRVMIKRL